MWCYGDNKNCKYDDIDCFYDNKMVFMMKLGLKFVGNFEICLLKIKYDIYYVCNNDIMSLRFF